MDHPMVPAAEQHEVVEPGRPAVSSVLDVMDIAAARVAARKSALPVPRQQRPPERRLERGVPDRPGRLT